MSKKVFQIWGRTLEIDIVYDCYRGEDVLESQIAAYEAFSAYSAVLFEEARKIAILYCQENYKEEIGDTEITNIFRYVKPKALYIKRSNASERIVAIICSYKFNPDDGMAIVFRNEAFSKIGTENIII